ncbi:quinoprotein relay system zinc metallohydrolase 2 [Methylobacillus gramineus]|uniref:quinoprotein relay system zinc metallohydrolase 2 n=1 Tax=Methylobacillus gramineus TaxID=755169 RepID=UPI001CFFBB84|nr:quinoprotein relay system zinc metallohydrolase 2 [Methylobacillus gramineus]MCB5186169.1 quinoprotein relay system zinc metallohydrolase 2 [Methylobacillus gramineus]
MLAPLAFAENLSIKEVASGVYVHQGVHEDLDDGYHGDISNIGFIIGSKGVAVIDTGGSYQLGSELRQAIAAVTKLPVLYVINTHIHPDHIFGNAAFLNDKAAFIGHSKLGNAMTLRQEAYMRQGNNLLKQAFAGSEIVKPSITVDTSQVIDLGNRTLVLTAYPSAHTNTDLTVFDEQTGTLWTGDLLFIDRTPSIDGDIKGWLATINKLKQLPGVNIAIPGHGPATTSFITALDNEYRYLDLLLNDVRASIKKGGTMEQAMQSAAGQERDKWLLFNSVNRRNVNLIYPVLEWE